MKILYCITQAKWGGAQAHVFELIKDQLNRKNDVYLVVGENGVLVDRLHEIGFSNIYILSYMKRAIGVNDIFAVFALRRFIKKIKPDLIHLHSSKAGIIGRIAASFTKCRVVFTIHGWSFTDGIAAKKKNVYRIIEKFMMYFTDLVICVSQFDFKIGVRDGVIKPQKKNAVVIHNGVSIPKKINNIDNDTKSSKIKIVMTARFSFQKDQDTLIKAISSIKSKKVEMIFVGDGETLKLCKALVNRLHLTSTVRFEGFQANVDKYLENCNIFVLSTHYEGLPISIIEAMSHKLPIIATNVGGINELVVDGENGFLCNGSVADMSEKLNLLIQNTNLCKKMADKSFDIYINEYVLADKLNKINYEYEQLMLGD